MHSVAFSQIRSTLALRVRLPENYGSLGVVSHNIRRVIGAGKAPRGEYERPRMSGMRDCLPGAVSSRSLGRLELVMVDETIALHKNLPS